MKRRATYALLTAATFSSACLQPKDGDVDEARDALPRAESIQINVPDSSGASKPAALGQISDMYKLTRATAGVLNGGAAVVLILVRTVTLFPPTTVSGETYTWGPWDGNALSPAQYRLIVSRQADGDYEWSFEGRRKADGASAPFEAVVAGEATPGTPGRGSGVFTMDFEVAERLDPVGNTGEGTLSVSYDLETNPATLTIDWEDAHARAVEYKYSEAADGSGDFQLTTFDDSWDIGTAFETWEMRTRWNATGAGRSDARLSGGDLGTTSHIVTECWNASYATTYHIDTAGWQGVQGSESACAYPTSKLPD